jgi:hypothetical protein
MHRLPYGFSENGQFAAKTIWNSVFLSRDPHILDRLYVMVLYMSFQKFQIFAQNTKVLAYGFREYR